ncbi:MAG: cytochrome-c oxidase, cbb3-type subunit III [Lysobacteraceae bacterium]
MSSGWSWYVVFIVALNVGGCVWLLWWTGKRRPGDPAPTDTSHVWDQDITEYNKPMPRWWIVLFYLTILYSLGYLWWYPGLGNYAGSAGWTSTGELRAEQDAADQRLAATYARFEGMGIDDIAGDPDALRIGRSVFGNYCSTCHGSDARGARGFPDLTDDVWHWGGTPQQIEQSVLHGRTAVMPPLGAAVGGDIGVTEVAVHVQSIAGQKVDPTLAAAGKVRFAGICAACHGADGTGNVALGAPDLTDSYWLYGSDFDSIRDGIVNGHDGQMPAHGPILGETRARMAAAYVYSLSRGGGDHADGGEP